MAQCFQYFIGIIRVRKLFQEADDMLKEFTETESTENNSQVADCFYCVSAALIILAIPAVTIYGIILFFSFMEKSIMLVICCWTAWLLALTLLLYLLGSCFIHMNASKYENQRNATEHSEWAGC